MNYDAELTRIITAIKADKSIVQPWKNYASKELGLAHACLRMGLTATNLHPPEDGYRYGLPPLDVLPDEGQLCTCTKHDGKITGKHQDCPVHGWSEK